MVFIRDVVKIVYPFIGDWIAPSKRLSCETVYRNMLGTIHGHRPVYTMSITPKVIAYV